MGAETHGMAQRGGSVVSHLRLGNVQGSLVRTHEAPILLALEENEGYRNLPFLARGGRFYVNTTSLLFPREDVRGFLAKRHIISRPVPAGKIAIDLGAPMSSNLALLGFCSAYEDNPFDYETLRQTIAQISPDRFRDKNLSIFDAGHQEAKKG
jgi:indolepyruvate ferredoxin oxidoreductase beta subunit